jgi:GT2 family glycosyltransferase
MLAPFHNSAVAGVKGRYCTRQRGLVARFVQQEYQERYDRMAKQPQIDFIDTYSAGYRRNIFLSAGGFDPHLPIAEDQEFSFRLAEQGYLLKYVPEAVVYHQHVQHIWAYMRRKFWIGYWKVLVMRRYPSKLATDSHTPQTLKIQMGLAALGGLFLLAGVIIGRPALLIIGGLAWLLLCFSGLPFYLKIWRRDPLVFLVAPLLLWARAWSLGLGFLVGTLYFFYRQPLQQTYENYKL